ncbi:MAG: VWA domain-containing protein [Planctomycetota bacterium]|nr:VWA domain-containing protein [Planctomycetota bacterium]
MSFALPSSLLLALFVAAFALLHYLRKRKRYINVPWLSLWQEAAKLSPSRSSSGFRFDLNLLLICLAVLLASLAAAMPRLSDSSVIARATFVLDTSASMKAESAFDEALKKLKQEISSAPDRAAINVITSAPSPGLLCKNASELKALNALQGIEPTDAHGDLREALALARRFGSGSKITVFSDHSPQILENERLHSFGQTLPNVGFVAAAVAGPNLFFSAANYSDTPYNSGAVLLSEKGEAELPLSIPPGKRLDRLVRLPENISGMLELRLNSDDSFALDDVLTVSGSLGRTLKLGMLEIQNADGSFGVTRALDAIRKGGLAQLQTTLVSADTLSSVDAVFTQGLWPAFDGPVFAFEPRNAPAMSLLSTIISGQARLTDAGKEFLSPLEPGSIRIERGTVTRAQCVQLSDEWEVLVSCEGWPLVAKSGSNMLATFAPRLADTELVADPVFVILLGEFVREALESNGAMQVLATSSAHPNTTLDGTRVYNLLSDVESDLRDRTTVTEAEDSAYKLSEQMRTVNAAPWFAVAALIMFLLSVLSAKLAD